MTICLLEINPKWLSRGHLLSTSLGCYNLTISIRLKHPNGKGQECLIWFVVTWKIKAGRLFNSSLSLDRWGNQGPKRLRCQPARSFRPAQISTRVPKAFASPTHRTHLWMPGGSVQLPGAPCAWLFCSDFCGFHQSAFPPTSLSH